MYLRGGGADYDLANSDKSISTYHIRHTTIVLDGNNSTGIIDVVVATAVATVAAAVVEAGAVVVAVVVVAVVVVVNGVR